MKQLYMQFRVVLYREEGCWIAHCLECDVMGDGKTQQEAVRQLCTAIEIQLEHAAQHNDPLNLFTPAEGKYFRMFAEGKNAALATLIIPYSDNKAVSLGEFHEYVDELTAT